MCSPARALCFPLFRLLRAVGMTQAANASAFEILKSNFLAAYHGDRAPMPLYVHSFFLRHGGNQQDVERFLGAGRLGTPPSGMCGLSLKTFLACPRTHALPRSLPLERSPRPCRPQHVADFALSHPHTYAVTMRQLIAYLQNPVPVEQLAPVALGCGRPGGAGPDRPS